MADMSELETAFMNADKAGDTQAASVLAAEIRRQRSLGQNTTEGPSSDQNPTRDSLNSSPDWISNAKTLYKETTKKDFDGSDAQAADWLKGYMSDFNYRLVGVDTGRENVNFRNTGGIAADVYKMSPEGKKAFLNSMDTFDKLPVSWEGTKAFLGRAVTDPSTYVGLGTFGIGTAASKTAQTAAKEGLKEALKFGLKQAGKGAAIGAVEGAAATGASDLLRQKAEIGAGRGDSIDWGRAGEAAAIGGATGGVLGGTVPLALEASTIAKGANRLAVQDKEAAGVLARDLKDLHDSGQFNLKDTNPASDGGAEQAIGTLQKNYRKEVSDNSELVKDLLDHRGLTPGPEKDAVMSARKAVAAALTDVKALPTKRSMEDLARVVGHTQEGQDLIKAIRVKAELNRVNTRGVKGGISRLTDDLNPLGTNSRYHGNPARSVQALASAINGSTFGIPGLIGQAATVAGGRLIDSFTGRRSLPHLFMRQNVDNAVGDLERTLPSHVEAQQAKAAEVAAQREADKAEKLKAAQDLADQKKRERAARQQAAEQARADRKTEAEKARNDRTAERQKKADELQKVKEARKAERARTLAEQEAKRQQEREYNQAYQEANFRNEQMNAQAKREAAAKAAEESKAKQVEAQNQREAAKAAKQAERERAQAEAKQARELEKKRKAEEAAQKAKQKAEEAKNAPPKKTPAQLLREAQQGQRSYTLDETFDNPKGSKQFDSQGRPILNETLYNARPERHNRLLDQVKEHADQEHNKHLRDILDAAHEWFSNSDAAKGRSGSDLPVNKAIRKRNRQAYFEEAINKGRTEHEREVIRSLLRPLAHFFD